MIQAPTSDTFEDGRIRNIPSPGPRMSSLGGMQPTCSNDLTFEK